MDCPRGKDPPYRQTPMTSAHYLARMMALLHDCSFECMMGSHRDYAAHIDISSATAGVVSTRTCSVFVECLGSNLKSLLD